MSKELSPSEIQRWFPEMWSEIAGNSKVVNKFKQLILNGVCSVLLTGPSRTCKTRVISLLIKALSCPNRTADLNPCNACSTCVDVMNARWEHWGVHRNWNLSCYSFMTIDCQTVQKEDLLTLRDKLDLESEKTIIYLDEVAALRQGNRDEVLLKVMDESKASWIASAIELRGPTKKGPTGPVQVISEPLLQRFPLKLGTSLPNNSELKSWIQARCQDWSIDVVDPNVTLGIVVKKSGNVVGRVMHFLTAAALNDRRLDKSLANEVSLDPLD